MCGRQTPRRALHEMKIYFIRALKRPPQSPHNETSRAIQHLSRAFWSFPTRSTTFVVPSSLICMYVCESERERGSERALEVNKIDGDRQMASLAISHHTVNFKDVSVHFSSFSLIHEHWLL